MVPAMAQATPVWGSFGTAAAVYGIGLLLAVPLALWRGVGLAPPPRKAIGLVLGAGVTETLGFVLLNAASRFAPVALVAPVASLAAVLTVLYAATFLRERPGRLALLGALLAGIGVVVLAL
jgi:drug/metabolite transporter (DMT)-like permease